MMSVFGGCWSRAAYLRQNGVQDAPSKNSVKAKLAISVLYFLILVFASTLSGPWAERKIWTAFSEWVAVFLITMFLWTTAVDFGQHLRCILLSFTNKKKV